MFQSKYSGAVRSKSQPPAIERMRSRGIKRVDTETGVKTKALI
ncbi:MAG TPA: hypothetical protein VED24_03230 [Candidatus Acidoferrum sp.]|nr:hypothetical protein [Candidatus Acidoferrum sp.]